MMHSENIIIVKATVEDAAMLTTISVTTFTDTFAKDNAKEDMDKYIAEEMNEETLTKELLNKNNHFFLIWHNNILAGYAKIRTGKIPAGLEHNNPLELERIYVLKEYLGKKIGATLMSYCLTYALSNKHDVMWLGVWEDNHRAVSFYKKWGFQLFGTHEFKLGNDVQTDILMKKVL